MTSFWYLPKQRLFRTRLSDCQKKFYIDLPLSELESEKYLLSKALTQKLKNLKRQYGIEKN